MAPSWLAVTARVLTAAACLLWAAAPLRAETAMNLQVDGVIANDHVTGSTPTFCWDVAGGQTNWQIQVDDDARFEPSARGGSRSPSVWFWDSGSQPKGPLGAARCAVMRQVVKPGSVSMGLDGRIGAIHWRVRVQTASGWGPWASSTLRVSQAPLMPAAVAVAADPRESSGPVLDPGVSSGRTFHVATTGDDANPGDAGRPFRTIAHAVGVLSAGDTLLVHGGVYEENVRVDRPRGAVASAGRAPVRVAAAPGEAPVLRSASTGSRVALEIGSDPAGGGWVFDGLTFGGAATRTAVVVTGASGVTLSNCRWEGTLDAGAAGVRVEGRSRDVIVTGCQFDQPLRHQVEIDGSSHVELRDNEFSGFGDGRAILVRGGSTAVTIEGNIVRDARPREAAVDLAGGATGTRIARNLFVRLAGGDRGAAVRVYRGGGLLVEHNVFHAIQGTAFQVNEHAPFGTYRNNIFSSCGTGLRFQGASSSVAGSVVDFNLFSGNGSDLEWGGASQTLLEHAPSGNCLGGAGGSCEPQFRDAARGDFRLRESSPAIDAADPFSPVPEGGGLRADIGPFESGAARRHPGTPAIEPQFSVTDPTPRISWSLDDLDDRLAPAGAASRQARFQIQVDPRPTFDAGAGSPWIDSGIVVSSAEQYVVPPARALTPGAWYARVRQWDEHAAAPGAWSDPPVRFTVQGGGPIELASAFPPPDATVPAGEPSRLKADLVSRHGCLEPSSVRLFVNGREVSPGLTGDAARLSLVYEPAGRFEAGDRVNVRVVAGCAGQPEAALDTAYTFAVIGPAPAPPTGLRVGR